MAALTIDQMGRVRAAVQALASLTPAEVAAMIDEMLDEHDGLADQLADAMSTALLEKSVRDEGSVDERPIGAPRL